MLVRRGQEQTWVGTAFDVHHMGGAYGRVPEQATPFPNRAAQYWINIYGFWPDPADDEARTAFVRGLSADLEPFASGGQYVNFQGHEHAGHRTLDPKAIFGPDKHARLLEVKRLHDPNNVFHINHNTPRAEPAGTAARVADRPVACCSPSPGCAAAMVHDHRPRFLAVVESSGISD